MPRRESLSEKASRDLNLLSGRSKYALLGSDEIIPLDEGGERQSSYEMDGDVMGFDMGTVSPYLSAFASGFGGGGQQQAQQQQAALQAQQERDRLQREKDAADARSRTAWLVAGIVGVGVVGTLIYFVARKK